MHAPCKPHMKATMPVLQYLKNNPSQGLFFPLQNDLSLHAFYDSDWGGCLVSRKSTTSYCVFFGILPHLLANKEAKGSFTILNKSLI